MSTIQHALTRTLRQRCFHHKATIRVALVPCLWRDDETGSEVFWRVDRPALSNCYMYDCLRLFSFDFS